MGLVTGVAMSKSALTVPEAIGMSLLVYAGSAQLAVLPLFAAGLPIWTIWLTAAVVNLRFVIFSAALQPHFSYLPMGRRTVLGFFNGDLHFVYFMQKYVEPGYAPGKEGYFWGMALVNCATWQVSSLLGILLASVFPDAWGLAGRRDGADSGDDRHDQLALHADGRGGVRRAGAAVLRPPVPAGAGGGRGGRAGGGHGQRRTGGARRLRGIRARKDKAKAEARAISEPQPAPQTGDRA